MSPELTWKSPPSFRLDGSGLFHASFEAVLELRIFLGAFVSTFVLGRKS